MPAESSHAGFVASKARIDRKNITLANCIRVLNMGVVQDESSGHPPYCDGDWDGPGRKGLARGNRHGPS